MSISASNLQGKPQKNHFSMRLLVQQCSSCYLEDGLRIFQFCDTSGEHKTYVNKLVHNQGTRERFV